MRNSLLVKVPGVLLIAGILWFGSGPSAWIAAAVASILLVGILSWFCFVPNSSFWAKTLWRAPRPTNAVALTFDDGPDPAFTPRILAVLAEKKVRAAFFVVGARARAHPDLLASLDEAGHLIGNHGYFHDLTFHFRRRRRLRREIDDCNAAVRAAVGRDPLLFRSPQGFKTPALGDALRATGMTAIGWQARGFDATTNDARAIAKRIVDGAKPGGVVMMHDGAGLGGTRDRSPTIEALPLVIDALRARGLDIVRLDELLEVPGYRADAEAGRAGERGGTKIAVKEKVDFVHETAIGTWFIRTPTWTDHVIRDALRDLERLIPERKERYPAILDIGCGHGAAFALLEEWFKPDRIVGVDADLESLERAATSASRCRARVELHNVSAAETGLPDSSFDMVFCHQSFHHLAEHDKAIREFHRLLKPGGILLFAESTRRYIHSLMIRVFFRHPMEVQKSAEEYLALVRGAGFEVREGSVSCPFLWWSRWDLGTFEWWGFKVPEVREETLVNAVGVKLGGSAR